MANLVEPDEMVQNVTSDLVCSLKPMCIYGKCPKILNTKVSDKMTYANSADPDQTAHGLHCLPFH